MKKFLVFSFLFFFFLACGEKSSSQKETMDDSDGESGIVADEKEDVRDLFDEKSVMEIRIEMSGESWKELRSENRSFIDAFGEKCGEPLEKIFSWFPASVTIDGEKVEGVGVRKKGFIGSLSDVRPSLKIKFPYMEEDRRFHGTKRMTLNNNLQDPSNLHQCLSYRLFYRAGLPSPRCSFARVYVNGSDLGIYSHVESIKKPFLERVFGNDEGNLYEGTVADFHENDRWRVRFEKKTNEEDPSTPEIDSLVEIFNDQNKDVHESLNELLDLDEFITFWAMEVVVGHTDGYSNNRNNYYFYTNSETGKIVFIPWGTDGAFRQKEDPPLKSAFIRGVIANRLYNDDAGFKEYRKRLNGLLETVWNEKEIEQWISSSEKLLSPHVPEKRKEKFEKGVGELREFVTKRKEYLKKWMEDDPAFAPAVDDPPPCFTQKGEAEVSFSTGWGTIGAQNPFFSGKGSFSMELKGTSFSAKTTGATVGIKEDNPEEVQLMLLGLMDNDDIFVVLVEMPEIKFQAGKISLDDSDVEAMLVLKRKHDKEPNLIGFVKKGTLNLSNVSKQKDAEVEGVLSGGLFVMF